MAYKQGKNPFSKNPLNFNSPLNSFDSLVGKLMNRGKSKRVATKIAGKGKYKMIGSNGKVVLSRDDTTEYLKDCGRMMKDHNNVLSKKLYKANVETIKQAYEDTEDGAVKDSYMKMIKLYEPDNE